MRKAIGKAMMVAGSAGAAASVAGVNPFIDTNTGLPQNHDDWMAVLFQVLVAAIGAIINGRGAGK
jgi:hypothetical protein